MLYVTFQCLRESSGERLGRFSGAKKAVR